MKTDVIRQLADLKKYGIPKETELVPDADRQVVINSKNKLRDIRTLGNPSLVAKAQKIYNPGQSDETKGPTATQTSLGTTNASDISGNWGKQNE